MDELVQEEFAVVPRICSDNNRVSDCYCSRRFGYDLRAPCRFRQLRVIWQRNPIDYENSHLRDFTNATTNGVGHLWRCQRDTIFEGDRHLCFCPLDCARGKTVEFFLINHETKAAKLAFL